MMNAAASEGDPLAKTAYRALRRLRAGGMGEVFLAEHRELGRRCVAKILHAHLAGEPRLVDRMRVEAQSLGRLNHPHIVSILGVGTTEDERPFLVMEHLEGRTLGEEISAHGGQLPVLDAVAYGCQLMSALAAAHGIGVVHRDIKPDNLFICERPDGARSLKVLDFGVARVLPDSAGAPAPLQVPTDTGVIVGTLRYVSPEAARGEAAGPRSDIYGAALVLYRMLAGVGPFDDIESEQELLRAHAERPPRRPSELARTPVPVELDRVVLRALSKEPADRFQTADELRVALEEIGQALSGPVGWAETSTYDPSAWAPPQEEAPGAAPPGATRGWANPAATAAEPPLLATALRKRSLALLFGLTVVTVVLVVTAVFGVVMALR